MQSSHRQQVSECDYEPIKQYLWMNKTEHMQFSHITKYYYSSDFFPQTFKNIKITFSLWATQNQTRG